MRFSYIVGKSDKLSLDLIWLTPVITICGSSHSRPRGYSSRQSLDDYRDKSFSQNKYTKYVKKISKQPQRAAELLAKTAALKEQGNVYMYLSSLVADLLQNMKTKPNNWKLDQSLASLIFSTISTTMEPVMIPEKLDITRFTDILKTEKQQKLSSGGLDDKRRKAILSLDNEIPLSIQATDFVRVDTTLINEVIQSLENKVEFKELKEFRLKKSGKTAMKQGKEIIKRFNLKRRKGSNLLQDILVSYSAAAENGAAYKEILSKLITAVCNTRMSDNVPECVAEYFLNILKINIRTTLSKIQTGKHHYFEAISAANQDFGCEIATEDETQSETPGGPCRYEKLLAVVKSKSARQNQSEAHMLKVVASLAQQQGRDQSAIDGRLARYKFKYTTKKNESPKKYETNDFLSIFGDEDLSTSATGVSNFSDETSRKKPVRKVSFLL